MWRDRENNFDSFQCSSMIYLYYILTDWFKIFNLSPTSCSNETRIWLLFMFFYFVFFFGLSLSWIRLLIPAAFSKNQRDWKSMRRRLILFTFKSNLWLNVSQLVCTRASSWRRSRHQLKVAFFVCLFPVPLARRSFATRFSGKEKHKQTRTRLLVL